MNKEQYQQWVNELPKLNLAQLSDLSARIKLLGQTSQKEHSGKSDFGERILQALIKVMRKQGLESPSFAVLKKSSAYASAKDKISDLQTFLESLHSSRLVQDQILFEAIELLYYDLVQWQGIAISSHTILNQIHRLPSSLHKAFPGYATSGLLHTIVSIK